MMPGNAWSASGQTATLAATWVEDTFDGVILDIVHKLPDQVGFVVLPKRWIVERTFAWLGRYRRLRKDYERLVENSAGMVYLASIDRMLTRLAPAA
jgi:putative transposase